MASRSCRAAFAQMIFQRQVFGKGSCAVVLAGVIDYMARSSREEIKIRDYYFLHWSHYNKFFCCKDRYNEASSMSQFCRNSATLRCCVRR